MTYVIYECDIPLIIIVYITLKSRGNNGNAGQTKCESGYAAYNRTLLCLSLSKSMFLLEDIAAKQYIGLFPNLHIWRKYTYTRHNVHITDKMCFKTSSWSKGKHNHRLHIYSQDHSIQSAEAGRLSSDNSIFQVNTVIKYSVKQNPPMPTGLMVSTSSPCREWGNSAKTKPIFLNYDVH